MKRLEKQIAAAKFLDGPPSESQFNIKAIRRLMPLQKPGSSKQDYATPAVFLDAVKKRFGVRDFTYDLAASQENTKARHFFCEEKDSLQQDWSRLHGSLWLNPPYAHIEPWAKKCSESAWFDSTMKKGADRRIFFLVPAAVGSNWFARWVDKKALVLLLNGRISFDGKAPYPKDCVLACYGLRASYEVWKWTTTK